VNGLLARSHEVTILHTGTHELEFDATVRHIHADPHFAASLAEALAGESFDLAIGMYGRLAHVVDALAGKTDRFIGIGAMYYEGWVDNVMHGESAGSDRATASYSNLIVPTPESAPRKALDGDRFTSKGIAAEDRVFQLHGEGRWQATFLRYPAIYGPGQHAPGLWPLFLRIEAGRPIVVPDEGLLLQTRAFTETAALHVLACVDHFESAAGEAFNVSDSYTFTLREWLQRIAAAMGREVELLSVPLFAAGPSFDYAKGPFTMGHKVADTAKARDRLRLRDLPDARESLARTVAWHFANRPPDEALDSIRAHWDTAAEDALAVTVQRFRNELASIEGQAFRFRHSYLHPAETDEVGRPTRVRRV
jgi:nucleoside-diphosphate-sugar epimerase